MIIEDYEIKEDKVSLTLFGKEDLVGTYYYKNKEDLDIIRFGEKVIIRGKLKVPSNNTIPHTFNYKNYLLHKGINYTVTISSIKSIGKGNILYKLKNEMSERIDKIDSSGYLKAFILGDKSYISKDVYNNYQEVGITHLFALSGMHIGLLSEILIRVLKRLKMTYKYLIIDSLLVCYGFLVCFPASIKRCIIFYLLNSINKVFNLELDNKRILFITCWLLIIFDYQIIYDTGFWFSICTVGGIILCNSFINDENKVKSMFKLSLIAFLFSLPISLFSFYQVNILSTFYNMLFVPLVSLIIYPLSLITFICPWFYNLFYFFIKVMEFIAFLLKRIDIGIIYMSFNIFEVIIFYIILGLVFIKKYYKCSILLILVILFDLLIPYFDKNNYVYFLDVGQGDASLVISANRKDVLMIDTGGDANYEVSDNYVSLLKYLGIKRLDYLILSHGDFDHCGETIKLLDSIKINNVVFNSDSIDELEEQIIIELKKKKVNYFNNVSALNLNNLKLEFLNGNLYDNENDNSNIVHFKMDSYSFLYMGDASKERERDLLKNYSLDTVDVLKVGHHGSKTSSSKDFVGRINPQYSIISVGRKNRYGHPNKETLNNLRESKIYRTDLDGSITFKIKNDKLQIVFSKP